tara:strand:+ start:109 stop:573 length:465 start_codon:yes stop_codon:yes gene_type:complete
MPNWCENEVSISGDIKHIKKIEKLLKSKDTVFDFNKVIPEPDWKKIPNADGELPYLDDENKDFTFSRFKSTGEQDVRWYDWRINNWGTKWGLDDDVDCDHDEWTLRYNFATAWSPPTGVYQELYDIAQKINEDIHISWFYREDGMGFAGYLENE